MLQPALKRSCASMLAHSTILFLSVLVCVAPALAQQPPAVETPAAIAPVIELVPEAGGGMPPEAESPETTLRTFAAPRSGDRISAEALATNGALNDASTGVMLEAFTNTPNLFMRMGRSDSSGSFSVMNALNESLFNVRGDGYATLRRDYLGETFLEIANANAGTSATRSSAGVKFTEGGASKAVFKIMGSASAPYGNNLFLWSYVDGPILFGTAATERMRINANGNIALNYPGVHNSRLVVQHFTDNSTGVFVTHQTTVEANTTQDDKALTLQATENGSAGTLNTGSLYGLHSWTYTTGPGALSNLYGAHILTGPTAGGNVSTSYGLLLTSVATNGGSVGTGFGAYVADVHATNDYAFYQPGVNDTNFFGGNVIIGGTPSTTSPYALSVQGNVNVNGALTGTNIRAHYQDVAEWVPSASDLAPGTVVILNRERNNEVMASATPYDTTVAGVVSAQPGISLGLEGEGKEQIATTGRVKVRVDARTAAVRIGDLLVTSDLPGTAMRSQPMDINGRQFHQPGTIIGKALEPLENGVGEILVLLSMQ